MQSISWRGDDGRYHIRTSVQGPFIVKSKLCFIFGLNLADLHVFCERVGGGFGGKQDMMSEDLPLLATLKTGRPVMWEFTREEQFTGATTKHPMKTHVKIGAKKDGTITAIQYRVVSNTGAYGNHGGETLANGMSGPWALYKCPNKKGDGYAVYTNLQCGGGFRGYGTSQTTFAIESAIDELAHMLGIDPIEFRRKNIVGPYDNIESALERGDAISRSAATASINASTRSSRALRSGRGRKARRRALAGRQRHRDLHARLRSADRAALGLGDRAARRRHAITLRSDRPRSATGSSPRSSRSSRRSWAARRRACRILNADTDKTPYDSGTFASVGMMVPTKAVENAAVALREKILGYASRSTGEKLERCRLDDDRVVCGRRKISLKELYAKGAAEGVEFDRVPQSVRFAAHGSVLRLRRAPSGPSHHRGDRRSL